MASDEQEQLAKKIREFTSSTRQRNLTMKKLKGLIAHWYFSKVEKMSLMLL